MCPAATELKGLSVPLAILLKDYECDPSRLQRISHRVSKPPLEVVPFDPTWADRFLELHKRIVSALGDVAILVAHTGSTSIPGIPAKPVIDIDLVVSELENEASYVPALEAAGFQFLLREPEWHGHRFFCGYEPISCNLHVWGPANPEVERHRIFRDWLIGNDDDRELYAHVKKGAVAETVMRGENVEEYNKRKEHIIKEILQRAFRSLGYLDGVDTEATAAPQT